MCGRYSLFKLEMLLKRFPFVEETPDLKPRYNIAPTQPVLAIPNNHSNRMEFFHWGLIPSWAKAPSIGGRMCNARAETLAEKPAFRTAFKRRRCIVPADGFYEWKQEPGAKRKTPMRIQMKSGEPFGLAGLWEVWHSEDGSSIPSCTLITTSPNELMSPIHDRMPVILKEKDYQRWLDPAERNSDDLADILAPYAADEMEASAVSTIVNNARNENADCLTPPTPETLFG